MIKALSIFSLVGILALFAILFGVSFLCMSICTLGFDLPECLKSGRTCGDMDWWREVLVEYGEVRQNVGVGDGLVY